MTRNDPFARLPQVPSFLLSSDSVRDGEPLPPARHAEELSGLFGVPGGRDASPHLSWSGAPEDTQGYAVTVYDPDAPTGSGLWHWAVTGIPSAVTSLPEGAGDDTGSGLPAGAVQLRNDVGAARFVGGAPPAGDGSHRYVITVHALDVADVGVPADATPALLGFTMREHVLARATLTPIAETPAAA